MAKGTWHKCHLPKQFLSCLGMFEVSLVEVDLGGCLLLLGFGWLPLRIGTLEKNYTSVDPKQFTVSKFRLKPVILILNVFVLDAATPTNTHPPHEGRQPETTGDKTTSEPKKATTPTNTKAARSKVALRTPTVNCFGNK